MRTYLTPIVQLLFVTVGVGCSKETEPTPFGCVEIQAQIKESDLTKTTMSGSRASFVSGDNIGLFETLTGVSNRSYTYNGTSWTTPTPTYWRDGFSLHTFYGYYPYKAANVGTKITIPILSSQTITTQPSPSADLLVAGPLTGTRSASVKLIFTHAFALIQLNIKMGILNLINPYQLNRITIRGGNPSGTSNRYGIVNVTGTPTTTWYDLSSASITAATNDSQNYAQSFFSNITGINLTTTAITVYAFVLPGTYTAPAPAVSFNLSLLGISSNTGFVNFSNTTFQAGTKYVYDVSIGLLSRSSEIETTIRLHEINEMNKR